MGKNLFIILELLIIISSCAILREPTIEKHESFDSYEYVVVPSTGELSSGSSDYNGYMFNNSVNPGSVIEGILLKKGFKSIDKVPAELNDKTLIVKYGESGKRVIAGGLGGYTMEVTIVFMDANTFETIYSCTAEGQGETEANDIREAIKRCLSGI